MYIAFNDSKQDTATHSLAYDLGIGPNCRWRTMSSGIKLTYEDNEAELVSVWVAVQPRRTIVEDTAPQYVSRFKEVYAL